MAGADKIIVTNRAALTAKYGAAGRRRVERALSRLVRADSERDVETRVVYLDDREQMRALGAPRVREADSPAQNKRAIDGVHAAETPDYLMILGATDVVPHQILKNPARDEDGATLPSDLPYACDAPYGRKPEDFIGPTRVVGRLPDPVGASDPGELVALLGVAARWKPRAPRRYASGFVLSAEAWKASTQRSARRLFGHDRGVKRSPPSGPRWKSSLLRRAVHFVNCHGAPAEPAFYGDPGDPLPPALRSTRLPGVQEGTVVAAECCYGAELYDAGAYGLDPAICNTYLRKKAYGYFGSTTIAYGPASGSGYADLVCIYFLQNVQRGASLGRAALQARLEFVRRCAPLNPVHLKTLAQFQLYADPSVHPARRGARARRARKRVARKAARARAKSAAPVERRGRRSRRRSLHANGERLGRETSSTLSRPDRSRRTLPKGPIANVVAYLRLRARVVQTFDLRAAQGGAARAPGVPGKAATGLRRASRDRFHVMIDHHTCQAGSSADGARVQRHLAVVVHERGSQESFEVLISR